MMVKFFFNDFLSLDTLYCERNIENQLVQHVSKFLLELGKGFAFVGQQCKPKVAENEDPQTILRRDSLCNMFAIRSYALLLLLMLFALPALPQARQSNSPVVTSAIKMDITRLRNLPQAMKPKSPVFPTRSKTERKPFVKKNWIIDSISPCYVANINPEDVEDAIFTITNIEPYPHKGKKVYLEQLAAIMGLPAAKPNIALKSDSISVQFIIFKNGWIAALTCTEPNTPGHGAILHAIKKNACVWRPALQEGRPLVYLQKMVIYYRRDHNGNIQSLDDFDDRPSANIQKNNPIPRKNTG